MAGQWLSRPGADVEFLAGDPKEAAKLEETFRKNPKDQALVGRYRFKGEPAGAEAQPDFTGRIKKWFTDAPQPDSLQGRIESASPVLGTLGAGQRMAANALLPGTNTGAAVDAAALAAPGILPIKEGLKALPTAARVAGRIAIPAAAGAGMGALNSEGAMEGAKLGGMAGTAGEAVGMLPAGLSVFYKKYGHFNTEAFKRTVRNKIGSKVAGAIAEDIPSLGAATPIVSTRDIDQITEPLGGQRVMGKMFDSTEGKIVQALQGVKVDIPFQALLMAGKAKLSPGSTASGIAPGTMVSVTPAEAIRTAKEVRALAFKGVQDATGQPMRELADRTHQALLGAVQKADPKLAGQYVQLRDDYGKFLDLKDFLKGQNTDLLPTMPDGGPTIDLPKFYDAMRSSNSTIDQARFTKLYDVFEGGTSGGPVSGSGRSMPRAVLGGKGARIAESLHIPERVRLSRPLEEGVGSAAKLESAAGKIRAGGTISSVPAIEQILMDQQQSANEPMPSSLIKEAQPTAQP